MSVKSLSAETIKGTFFLGSWGMISKVLAIFNSFIIIYLLSVYEYGLYTLVLSVVSLAQVLLLENMDQLIINEILIEKSRDDFQRAKKIYQEYFAVNLLFCTVGFLLLFFGSQIIASYTGHVSIGLFIKLGSFLVLVRASISFFKVILYINNKFIQLGSYTFSQELFKLIILLTMLVFIEPGIAKIIFAMILANSISIVILLIRSLNDFKYWLKDFRINFRKMELWRIMKAHGKWSMVENFLANLQKNLMPWLIQLSINTEAVGLYNFGKNLYKQLDELLPIRKVISQLLPEIFSDKKRLQRVLIYGTKYYTLISILTSLAGITAIPYFIYLFFPKYIYAIPVFLIFMFIPLSFGGLFQITNSVLFSLRQQKFLTYMVGLRVFLVVILNALLLPIFGVYGAAMERVITLFISTVIVHYKTTKYLGMKFFSLGEIFAYTNIDSMLINNFLIRLKSSLNRLCKRSAL